jgi:hypothetical protein
MERTFLVIIILIGVGMAVLMSAVNGTWRLTHFSDYHDDAEVYNITALSILEHHSFAENDARGFVGIFRRSPGYPLFLALSYALLGKMPPAAFITQAIIFTLSLILLWALARFFIPSPYYVLPSLFLALSWFIALQVTSIVPELFTLFLLLLFLWAYEKFFTTDRYAFLFLSGGALAWFILTRAVALYGMPVIIALLLFRSYSYYGSWKKSLRILGAFLIIPIFAVGAWMIRSVVVLDTWQIQSGSYVLAWKSMEATASWQRIAATFTATLTGDVVAEKFFPGYVKEPDHYRYTKIVTAQMLALDAEGIPESEKEQTLYREARERIKDQPLKFFVSGVMGFFRQNVPLNHRAQPITHLFNNGQFASLPTTQKIGILLVLRVIGYFFLALITYGAITKRSQWRLWGMVFFWVAFYNLFYAFFTHNEPRYMLPLWPLYLLFAATAVTSLLNRHAKSI